jgi:hypothetical protein
MANDKTTSNVMQQTSQISLTTIEKDNFTGLEGVVTPYTRGRLGRERGQKWKGNYSTYTHLLTLSE